MFRPIKNFINYIQKNASGSAIFGNTTTGADNETVRGAEEIGIEATKVICEQSEVTRGESEKIYAKESSISKVIINPREHKEMKRIQVNKMNCVNGKSDPGQVVNAKELNGVGGDVAAYAGDDTDDDIELQIKSSVMLRAPLKRVSVVENLTDEVDADDVESLELNRSQGSIYDHSDGIEVDSQDEYDDYPREGAEAISVLSDDGTTAGGGEDTAEDDFVTEEEDAEDTFLNLPSYQEHRFEDSEIIVLNDVDVNSSIASDAPSEDPLAIDDFTQPSISANKDSSNPLDSSTNDEASTSADLLWINIDELKTNTTTPNAEKDLLTEPQLIHTPTSTPQRQLTANVVKEKRNSSGGSANSSNNAATTTLNTQGDEHAEEIRSDGSDSGLGSETSTLQTTLASLGDTSHLTAPSGNSATNTPTGGKTKTSASNSCSTGDTASNLTVTDGVAGTSSAIVPVAVTVALPPLAAVAKPLRSNLKRRLDEEEALVDAAQQTQLATTGGSQVKKPKRSINFENVQVYYFPRQQGFGCVPSAGGCTLGMGARHIGFKTLTLAEHAAELRRAHRLQLQEINPRGSSSDDSEESEEDYLSEGSGSDLDAESNGFLQPVSPKQRRALLKAAGVRKIDAAEKIECRDIRNSREVCGCTCVEFCDPETCACSQAGIKCQVDRAMFPCGCTRDACGNTVGRVEFNPTRVRTHFIHTIMRLEMENRQQQNPPLCSTVSSYSLATACATTATAVGPPLANTLPPTPSYANNLPGSYYAMQTQSNYSSGYASPAYPSEPAANYYQQQSSSSAHYSAVSTTEQQSYQLDTLDAANLFTGPATATPVYGEMVPAYSSAVGVAASTATVSAYHQNINYSAVQQTQVSTFTAYQQTSSAAYLPQHSQQSATTTAAAATTHSTLPPPTTFSSCAVPSLPPYGTATTTAAAAQYQDTSSYALVGTTAPSCISIDDSGGRELVECATEVDIGNVDCGATNTSDNSSAAKTTTIEITSCSSSNSNRMLAAKDSIGDISGFGDNGTGSDSSFIQLSTPISSAARLSQINDLLLQNRHTTATLVAISQTSCLSVSARTSTSTLISSRSVTTDCEEEEQEEDETEDELEEKVADEVAAKDEKTLITESQYSGDDENGGEKTALQPAAVAVAETEPTPAASENPGINDDTVEKPSGGSAATTCAGTEKANVTPSSVVALVADNCAVSGVSAAAITTTVTANTDTSAVDSACK
ncbi:PREDICTED: uncharacterized protein LOC108363141 isoform X2 [Rhagoletis zephyria]|uniref:uncharacterized protein LOC108363141 isoform X2 n=1 Tax=Rhagoletis zephyria TaxID=28612 RepID=UPI00081163F0|nr:PREDICTED: uncharacterized protein LOC108363141 isoform X2 [Rhagoletis zephyria]